MADITLMGATFYNVPAVELPTAGGGTTTFTDVSDTTASASDVASGKYFYTSSGVRAQGTSAGGVVVTESTTTGGGIVKEITAGTVTNLQERTATPTTSTQNITPQTGYDALSKVVVNPIPSEYADVTDTTAVASDVASGKYFYTASGVRTLGTATGGASNFVMGTFTTTSTTNTTGTVDINYTGSGYPIALLVYVDGGMYNNSTGGNTTWYNSTQRYAVGQYSMVKARTTTTPTYGTSGTDNYGVVQIIYKNSTSSGTSYTQTSTRSANSYTSSSTNASTSTLCVRFQGSGKKLTYYTGYYTSSSAYGTGLLANTKYAYIAVYSS